MFSFVWSLCFVLAFDSGTQTLLQSSFVKVSFIYFLLLSLQINATTFEVHSSDDNKVYKFITHDELTAQHWVDAINSVKKDH